MVALNRIYTRAGDGGRTQLANGERRPKHDLRIETYGTVDETNAAIGLARLHTADDPETDAMLGRVQNDLFDLGADLATPPSADAPKREPLRILDSQVARLEREIDAMNEDPRAAAFVRPARRLPRGRPPPPRSRGLPTGRAPGRRPVGKAGGAGLARLRQIPEPVVGPALRRLAARERARPRATCSGSLARTGERGFGATLMNRLLEAGILHCKMADPTLRSAPSML